MVNKDYRVDVIICESTQAELTKVQQKLNQWISTSQLVKYEIHVNGSTTIFNVCRIKQGE